MPKLTRREFLISLGTLPFVKLAIPQLVIPATRQLAQQSDDGTTANQPNILVMVFDTFSANHLATEGYRRDTAPNLTRLAEKATVFHNHYAAGSFTSPGTASLLTGLYPWTHRSLQTYGHALPRVAANNIFNLLPDTYYKVAYTHNPLASALLHQFRRPIDELKPRRELVKMDGLWSDVRFANDYPVAINAERLISGLNLPPSSIYLDMFRSLRATTTRNEYERQYAEMFPRGVPEDDADMLYGLYTVEDAIDWVAELATSYPTPTFSYIHLWPPHAPYTTRREFIDIFQDGWQPVEKPKNPLDDEAVPQQKLNEWRRFYDEYVAYVDAEFARLFDLLEKSGALENTYLILTSDHGELFERGIRGHTTSVLYDSLLHVPMMVWKPGQTARVDVYEHTSAVDLVPTLLHLTGQPIPEMAEGMIMPTFGGPAVSSERDVYGVEAKRNNAFAPLTIGTVALHRGPHKLVQYFGYKGLSSGESYYELFNLDNDPDELDNRYATDTALARELQEQLRLKLEEADRSFRAG